MGFGGSPGLGHPVQVLVRADEVRRLEFGILSRSGSINFVLVALRHSSPHGLSCGKFHVFLVLGPLITGHISREGMEGASTRGRGRRRAGGSRARGA